MTDQPTVPPFVDASPAKRFFIKMLVRDIRLEDAILDLVDNAMDSLVRHGGAELHELVSGLTGSNRTTAPSHLLTIDIQEGRFRIEDNCGGIELDQALKQVFRFGADDKVEDSRLSVYGIGLKRAVLKIGRQIEVQSQTMESGFSVTIDVGQFEVSPDWQFPIVVRPAADRPETCGTTITVTELTSEAKSRIAGGTFADDLMSAIGQSYSLFLDKAVTVKCNGVKVQPTIIKVSDSSDVASALSRHRFGKVEITIVAGLQGVDEEGEWKGATAGWYIICNGRVVVFGDKTTLTGWGAGTFPSFQPKHRGFIGVALFMSDDPEALPWTTTKRGVNAESAVFQFIKERMTSDARPVIAFLDRRYASVPVSSENTDNLAVQDGALKSAIQEGTAISRMFQEEARPFRTASAIRKKADTTSVQYRTAASNIDRARRAIGDLRMAAGKVGAHALNYFLKNEASK